MFAHWTEVSKALLAGEVSPVFRVKRKLDDATEVSLKWFAVIVVWSRFDLLIYVFLFCKMTFKDMKKADTFSFLLDQWRGAIAETM